MRPLLAASLLALASCSRPAPRPSEIPTGFSDTTEAPQPPPTPGPHSDLSLDWDRFACRYFPDAWHDHRRALSECDLRQQALEVAELRYSRREISVLTLEQIRATADAALEREERQLERLERLVKNKRRELEATTHRSTP